MSVASNGTKRRKVDFSEVIQRGRATEQNVGLTEFIGKQKPFIGILKHRFEDFVVHEINPKGEMVKLESVVKPDDIALEEEESEEKVEATDLSLDEKILEDIRAYSENNTDKSPVLIPVADLNKEQRTRVHAYIRQNYSNLDSKTETIDQKSYIKVVANAAGGKDPRRQGREKRKGDNRSQRRLRWPKSKPNYVHFVLYKENMETVQVVNELSRRLACTPKNFTFAGTKDKRAITTQRFAVWKTNPAQVWHVVQEFNRRARFNNKMAVGHFEYAPDQLKLGDLAGNHFEIVLRNVRLVESDQSAGDRQTNSAELRQNVEQSLQTVKDTGFINYFGMQRFGSHRVDSHKLGILILKRQFKQLVNEILVEKPIDVRAYGDSRNDASFNEAIRIWRDTGDAGQAYKRINLKYTIEGSLLRALTRVDPNDYHGALCIGLLRNSRLLYLHAYQSYLWNRVASYRIQEYGLEVVEGDLVFVGPDVLIAAVDVEEELEAEEGEEQSQQESPAESSEPTNGTKAGAPKANIPADQIVLVTADNRSQFTIYDVVLPIIGGLSKLPTNRTRDHIDLLLKEDGIHLEDFGSLSKQWCVNGSYRKLLVRPTDFEWTWSTYVDDTKPLIDTDLDLIKGGKKGKKADTAEQETTNEEEHSSELHRTALRLGFTLPTSSYATVLLRELTKLSSLSLENKPWQQPTTTTTEPSSPPESNQNTEQTTKVQTKPEDSESSAAASAAAAAVVAAVVPV